MKNTSSSLSPLRCMQMCCEMYNCGKLFMFTNLIEKNVIWQRKHISRGGAEEFVNIIRNVLHYENISLNFHDIKFLASFFLCLNYEREALKRNVCMACGWIEKGWAEKEKIHSELIIYDSRVSWRCFFTSPSPSCRVFFRWQKHFFLPCKCFFGEFWVKSFFIEYCDVPHKLPPFNMTTLESLHASFQLELLIDSPY